jgi:hypothetical protein
VKPQFPQTLTGHPKLASDKNQLHCKHNRHAHAHTYSGLLAFGIVNEEFLGGLETDDLYIET